MFKIKDDSTYKGRLVVEGFFKIHGVDCGDTFAPVCRLQSIRMILATAAELDYKVHMLDVQTAFLNADVEEDVFVKLAKQEFFSHEAQEDIVRSSTESKGLVRYDGW